MLDGFKAMRKLHSIQIQAADMSGSSDYKVYREHHGTETQLIARQVSEDQIEQLLNERDYRKFQAGAYRFRVSCQLLADILQYV